MQKLEHKHRSETKLPDIKKHALTCLAWNDFKTDVTNSLSTITGVIGIPLMYVIRPIVINNYEALYSTCMELLTACA